MTNMPDLIKIMRQKGRGERNSVGDRWGDDWCLHAADLLEAADASERRCEAKLSEIAHKLKDMEDRAFAAERERDEQREAFLDQARITDAYRAERKRDREALETAERERDEAVEIVRDWVPTFDPTHSKACNCRICRSRTFLTRYATGTREESDQC